MRILYFTRDYTLHDRRFLVELGASGHEIFFLRLENDGFSYEVRPLPRGVTEVAWQGGRLPAPDIDTWVSLVPALLEVINQVKPHVVHAGPVPSCGFMAALTGFHPLLIMSWGSDVLVDAASDESLAHASASALRQADGFLCDCNAVRRRAQEIWPIPDDRIVQFPWGVDLELFRPVSDRSAIRQFLGLDDGFLVLSTRLWEPRYAIDTLLDAVELARASVPELRLLLLGDGSLRDSVRDRIASPGLAGAVFTPGLVPHDRLSSYFQAADLYVSCSTSDGSSVSLLEAMACGLPVVVSATPGNLEWVTDREAGALVPTGHAVEFSGAITRFAGLSPAKRKEIERRNRHLVSTRADWRTNVERLFNAYERLLTLGKEG